MSNTNRQGLRSWGIRPARVGHFHHTFSGDLLDKNQPLELQSTKVNSAPKAISKLRSALASALALWCAGTGCMMVSYARAAALANSEVSVSKSPANNSGHASMGSHDCCKARRSSARRHSTINRKYSRTRAVTIRRPVAPSLGTKSSNAASCCPLTSGSFVIQSRSVSSSDEGSPLNRSELLSFGLSGSESSLRAIPLRINQERTYLTCCAFLI